MLLAAELGAAGLLVWTGDGIIRWLGILLLVGGAVLVVKLLRGAGNDTKALINALRAANQPEGDLTRLLPAADRGPMRELTTQLNQFMERIRRTLEDLQQHSIRVSLASAYGRKFAEEASSNAARQEEYSELIFSSSNETAAAIEDLSRRTNGIADVNSRNLHMARNSLTELGQVSERIGSVASMLQDFHGTVGPSGNHAQQYPRHPEHGAELRCPDQHPGAERRHRGGADRRARPRFRRCRRRGAQLG
jgi:methyl-accepting chemotaxis protein